MNELVKMKDKKFNDKTFIMNCDMPSDLFTVKGIKAEYRTLAKLWHPDVNKHSEGLYIMSKINALYNEGLNLIAQNKFYEKDRLINRRKTTQKSQEQPKKSTEPPKTKRSKTKRTIEVINLEGKKIRFKYLKRVLIELGFMYVSETYVMFEITKLKRRIFMDALQAVEQCNQGFLKIQVPQVIDSFETQTHGYIVIKKEKGVEPVVVLEHVSSYLKPLASRKICEGLFYDMTVLKHMGMTTTGLDKELLFINVYNGKLSNFGTYFYLHEFNATLKRAPKDVSESLNEIKAKQGESRIIELVKSTVHKLNERSGGVVDDFYNWIHTLESDSLEMSLAESQVFNRAIASVTNHGFDLENYYAAISSQ